MQNEVSPYRLSDTLDICAYRRNSPQITPTKEPMTPIKRKSAARNLGAFETSNDSGAKADNSLSGQSSVNSSHRSKNAHNTSDVNAHEFDSKSSAYFSGQSSLLDKSLAANDADSFNMAFAMTDSSAYRSDRSLHDTLEVYDYRQKLPKIIVTLETTVGSEVQEQYSMLGPVTSSPLKSKAIDQREFSKFVDLDPNNFDDSLEFVDYRLKACGYVPMSPTKMAKRKRLMENYVADLLKQESDQRAAAKLAAKRLAAAKRTISVDRTMKVLL